MNPVEIPPLEPHVAGDTWEGVSSIGPITIDGLMPASPLVSARMCFIRQEGHPPAAVFSTTPAAGEGAIVIVSAAAWELMIPPVAPALFPLTEGTWLWGLEVTDAAGEVGTPYHGTQLVKPSRTRTHP